VLFILTLPVLLPPPPGLSMVLALPLLLVAPQLIVGRRPVWLPKFLRKRTIKRKALVKLNRRVLPAVEKIETVVRPRLGFLTGAFGTPLVGIACTIIALVLVLPIPFANLAPEIAMGVFSIGLTRKGRAVRPGGLWNDDRRRGCDRARRPWLRPGPGSPSIPDVSTARREAGNAHRRWSDRRPDGTSARNAVGRKVIFTSRSI